ncbi:MAG: 50S ribosomal protein L24 [Dehalococcoidia bacterium]|nr:50S ribosomal protein L24 [Dehalococcoidia bacterium]
MALKIRKDDTVLVITGKDRGRSGKVLRTFPRDGKLLVQGVNLVKRHQRARPGVRQSGIVEKEAPLYVSKVMLLVNGEPTRVGFTTLSDGTKARVARRTGEQVG